MTFTEFHYRKEKDPLKPKHPISSFFLFTNERRAALVAENKSVLEVAKITGEEWKNMTVEQKGPYEEVYFFISYISYKWNLLLHICVIFFIFFSSYISFCLGNLQIARKNKEKYSQEMEVYKQMKDDEASSLRKEEEEQKKLQKQEALQLLKKKEKTENIIKVL